MKSTNHKLLTIVALIVMMMLTSCKESSTKNNTTETNTDIKLKITTPQPSPLARIEQRVGLTDISIEYSRPGVKGRAIFGDLVPYGKIWRTGANANTKVTISTDVTIDGQKLKAGSYGIYTIPNKNKWEVLFYSEAGKRGVPKDWDDSKIALQTSVDAVTMPMNIETFTIMFNELTNSSAVMGFLWEQTFIGIKFEVPTDQIVMATIDAVMSSNPTANDFYNAAIYYNHENKDIQLANEWMEKAMSLTEKPAFWQLRQQSLIYAKMGNKNKAIEVAKKSLALSEKAENDAYIKMNTKSLKEWEAQL